MKKQLVAFMREAFEDWAGADLQFANGMVRVQSLIARVLFYIFVVIFVVLLILGLVAARRV